MLVGSGGVVALVVGGWAVLWAVRAVPERGLRASVPVIAAFAATILGFAWWTAHAEAVLGLVAWMAAAAEHRVAVASVARAHTARPLIGAGVTLLVFAGTLVALHRVQGSGVQLPSAAATPPRAVRWFEGIITIALIPPFLVALVAWIQLRSALSEVTGGHAPLLTTLPKMQFLAALGTLADVTLIALALLLGAGRTVRALRGWQRERRSPVTTR